MATKSKKTEKVNKNSKKLKASNKKFKVNSKKDKQTKKKIIISAIIVVFVLVAGATIWTVITDSKQEEILREEITNLSKKDIKKDRYNNTIKTHGDYAIVEDTIKKYLDDYAVNLQGLLKIMNDQKLSNILSVSNLKEDGPDFVKTKEYLTKTKTEFNEKLTKLTKMTSENEIMAQIKNKNLDKFYINLYEELMLRGVAGSDFKTSREDLKSASDTINKILDTEEKIIDLLISNKGKWSIENDKLVFQNTDTLNKYNELKKQLS